MTNPNSNQEYVRSHFQNVKPFIDIRYGDAPSIYISKNVLVLIGSPNGVRIHFDKANKILALEASDLNDPDCFPVIGKTVAKTGILKVGSVSLVSLIWETLTWDEAFHYQILPKYYEVDNVATFNLETARKIEIPKSAVSQTGVI